MNQISCKEHENMIILVCLESDCRSNRVICSNCIKHHINHTDELVDLRSLQVINDSRLMKITQGKEKLKEVLEETREQFLTTLQQFQAELQDKEQPQNIYQASLDELQEVIHKNLKQRSQSETQTQTPKNPPEVKKECQFQQLFKKAIKAQKPIGISIVDLIILIILSKYCINNQNPPEQFNLYNTLEVTSSTLGKAFTFDPKIQNCCKINITPQNSIKLLGLVQGTQIQNYESMNQGLFILFTRNKIMMRTTKSVLEVKIHNTIKIDVGYSVVKQEDIYIPQTQNQKAQMIMFNHGVFLKSGVNYVLSIESSKGYKQQFYGFEINSQSKGIETSCTMVSQLLIA
ncbi:hypothetical protein pb186bvf_011908 [Paramecium bursaria]